MLSNTMLSNPKSLTIIVPAYNEAGNIRATCEAVSSLAGRFLADYEILVFDDASSDRTGPIVEELQRVDSHIILIRNPENRGLGYNYRTGVQRARCQYTILVPGDNEVIAESLGQAFGAIGATDAILCYSSNAAVRHWCRRVISRLFTGSLNCLFGLKVRYYNGPCIIRRDLAQRYAPQTASFGYMAIVLVRLLKAGFSYAEMPFALQGRNSGSTKAFRLKNIITVIWDILGLFWLLQICREKP